MIIVLVLAFALCFFLFMVLPLTKHRNLIAVLSLVGLIISGAVMVLNDSYHFGMKMQQTSKTVPLASSVSNTKILLFQPLGNGQEKIYLYKTKDSQKHLSKETTEHTTTTITHNQELKQPTKLTITTFRYVYASWISRLFFSPLDNDGHIEKVHYHFQIGKDWQIMSVPQLKQLIKLQQKNGKQ